MRKDEREEVLIVGGSYAGRLRQAIEAAGASVADVADALGVSYQAVRQAVVGAPAGTGAMTARNNSIVARYLKVCPDWLATGEGDMRPTRWPFGDVITPAQYFALPEAARIPAVDVLLAAVRRHEEAERPGDGLHERAQQVLR